MQYAIVPILAQRLMINMRKVDYLGSEPIASTLLFAPQGPSEKSEGCSENGVATATVQMSQEPSVLTARPPASVIIKETGNSGDAV